MATNCSSPLDVTAVLASEPGSLGRASLCVPEAPRDTPPTMGARSDCASILSAAAPEPTVFRLTIP